MGFKPFRSKRRRKYEGEYRSFLEEEFSDWVDTLGLAFLYEPIKIPYLVPAREKNYIPDFVFDKKSRRRIQKDLTLDDLKDKLIVETKGRLTFPDMEKMKLVKASNPDLDIRFVFPNDRILDKRRKGVSGKYRYSDWCLANNFPYYVGLNPPKEWFK